MITVSISLFSFGFLLNINKPMMSNCGKSCSNQIDFNISYLAKLVKFLVFIDILRLVYLTYIIFIQMSDGSVSNFMLNSTKIRRLYMDYDPGFIGNAFVFLCNTTAYIGFVVLGIYMARKGLKSNLALLIVFILELLISILTMSKLSFVIFLITISISFLNNVGSIYYQKKIIRKIIPIAFIILVLFFFFIGYQRNYMARGNFVEAVSNGVIDYFTGPTEALGIILSGQRVYVGDHGMISIGRTETNVFTWLRPFYLNLSYWGIIVWPLILGIISGRLYNHKKHSLFIDVSNAWICTILAMSFFDFLLMQTAYVFLFFYSYFIHKYFRRKLYIQV